MENEELEQQLNSQLNNAEIEEPEVETEEVESVEAEEEHEEREVTEEKPLSRAEQRFQKLANERAEEKAKRELAEKQAEFYRQQAERMQQAQHQPQEDLDPDEKWRREANNAIRQTQMMAADMADKAEFLSKYSKDPEVIALQSKIESTLAEKRAQGAYPSRELVLTFLLGQQALEKRANAPAVKREAAARVKAAQGQPLGSKSNVAPSKSPGSLADRLKDIPL